MQLFVPCVAGDHPAASVQNLISSPYCSCNWMSQCSTLIGSKNKRMYVHCRLFVLQTRGGMLCFFGFFSWKDSFRVGWWRGSPVQSQSKSTLKIYPERLTWTLDLSLSHLGVLACIIIQAMAEVPKELIFQASLWATLFFSIFYERTHHYLLFSWKVCTFYYILDDDSEEN